jgi:5-methylcytosine-specific restriction protein B
VAKYDALTRILEQQTTGRLVLTFQQIADIVDGLPPSAYQYREWWANSKDSVGQARGWLTAGWLASEVDLEGRRVTFRRETAPLAEPPEHPVVGAFARPGAAAIEVAAARIRDACLRTDDSVVTPGVPVWSISNASILHKEFVEQPDLGGGSFSEKLEGQLADVTSEARQLIAELLFVNVLPLSDYYPKTKRNLVNQVLAWCDPPLTLPDDLAACLESGVFNGGVAFKTLRWQQLSFLIQFVAHWKQLDAQRREAALTDPWTFRSVLRAAPGPKVPAQRNALLYLFYPETFLPIVKVEHRRRIRDAFIEYAAEPTGDVERDLAQIREAMEREHGSPFDYYVEPWRHRWDPAKQEEEAVTDAEEGESGATSPRRAWLLRGSSVAGVNLVPTWLAKGSTSLAASSLRAVEPGLSREELQAIVDADYQHVSYNARREKVDEFHAFLTGIQIGDLVLTTAGGKIYVGEVVGDPMYVESSDGRSNLRREVHWLNADRPIDYSELPDPLPARLSSQHTVVDLTSELELIQGLVTAAPHGPEGGLARPVVLPTPTRELAEKLLVDLPWLQECVDLLRDHRQVIFYGPPGTGKTYLAQHLARFLAGRENVKLVQFHPAYSYEDFFEGFRPHSAGDGQLGFDLRPGPFRKLVDRARDDTATPYVLVIDEINRANLAKVFGELYFLLEYRDEAIDLLYAADELGFTLPKNVFLIGTMNTADRSIALVDAAMRRRFAFVALHPSEEPTASMLDRWLEREHRPDTAARLLEQLNERIEDPDFKIGPSYLMRASVYQDGGLERVWRTSIMPLLQEHHYGEEIDLESRYGLRKLRARVESETRADEGVVSAEEVGGPDPSEAP